MPCSTAFKFWRVSTTCVGHSSTKQALSPAGPRDAGRKKLNSAGAQPAQRHKLKNTVDPRRNPATGDQVLLVQDGFLRVSMLLLLRCADDALGEAKTGKPPDTGPRSFPIILNITLDVTSPDASKKACAICPYLYGRQSNKAA